jgi:RecA-family ATPase
MNIPAPDSRIDEMVEIQRFKKAPLNANAIRRLTFTLYSDIDQQPRKQWLVENFLGAGELSCQFGAPGSGKSVAASDLGAHIAAGRDWFGRRVLQGAVLFVACERANLVKRRLAAFRKHHGLDDLPLAVCRGSIDLRSSGADAELIVAYANHLRDLTGFDVRLVIIDTISRSLAGGDENSSKDMGAIIASLTMIQETTGAHVLAVHHIPVDGTQRLRGHGALLGACDTTISVEKVGKLRTATVAKQNDGDEGEKVVFDLISVELSHNPETDEATTAPVVIPFDGEPPRAAPSRKLPPRHKLALESLTDLIADKGEPAPIFGRSTSPIGATSS